MTCNLMAFGAHPSDYRRPRVRLVVDLSFAIAVSRDEECCFCVVFFKQVENMIGVDVRSIVKCYRDGARNLHLQLAKYTYLDCHLAKPTVQ